MKFRTEEYEAILEHAEESDLTFSGAVRDLIRSHPTIGLPPVRRQQSTIQSAT